MTDKTAKTGKTEKPAKKKVYRTDTTETHPLFDGDPQRYNEDRRWRRNIPKAQG